MITAHQLEVRAGARLLMEDVSFRVAAGRQGRPGRAQRRRQDHPDQDPRRRGAARGRHGHAHRRRSATCRRTRAPATSRCSPATGSCPRAASTTSYAGCARPRPRWAATTRRSASGRCAATTRADAELHAGGGYAAESEAAADRRQPRHRGADPRPSRCSTLSGGQRRRVELARILFSGAETLLLDEPTNHLDADSIVWLRDFLAGPQGRPGRDQPRHRRCSRRRVNKVLHLDANRAEIDVYNMGWKALPRAARDRRAAPQARAGERREEGQDAHRPGQQDARQGHQGAGRAVDAQARREADGRPRGRAAGRQGRPDQVPGARRRAARPRSPRPSCRSPTARSRSSPTSTWPSTRAPGSSSSASTAPARPRCCGSSPASTSPTPARCVPGHGLKLGYYAQEHETLDTDRTVLENMQTRRARS